MEYPPQPNEETKPEAGWELPEAASTKQLATRAEQKIAEISSAQAAGKMTESLKKEAQSLVIETLQPEAMRGLIIRRGQDNKNLHVLKNSLDLLANFTFGKNSFLELEENEAVLALEKMGIEKVALNELFATFFHFGDQQNAQKVLKIIEKYKQEIGSPEIFLRGMMDKNSLLIKRGDDPDVSVIREIEGQSQDKELPVLAAKIGYGKLLVQGGKDKDQKENFRNLAGKFYTLGDIPDFLRAKAEQGLFSLSLAQKQEQQPQKRMVSLKECKELAGSIIKGAKKIDYPVVFIYGHLIRALANQQTIEAIEKKYGQQDRSQYSKSDLQSIESAQEVLQREQEVIVRLTRTYQYQFPKDEKLSKTTL